MLNTSEKSNEKEKESFGQIQESLERLASVREQTGGWLDSEEEPEEQSCVFKEMESLEPFLLANYLFPTDLARLSINEDLFLGDLDKIIDVIERDGFSASPYLFIREIPEFVDSASLALRIMVMFRKYVEKKIFKNKPKWSDLSIRTSDIVEKACDFIIKNGLGDKGKMSWAGSVFHSFKKINYCNVYFTCEAIRSLAFLNRHKNLFSYKNVGKVEEAIKAGCLWVLGRAKESIIFGDEGNTRSEINHSFYGLNGLFDCYDYLEQRQKDTVLSVFSSFVDRVEKGDEGLAWLRTIDVPMKAPSKPIYYEDRASAGNILTVLCKGRNIFREQAIIDDRFFEILRLWYQILISEQHSETQLWDKSDFLICYTARAIESLLYFSRHGQLIKYEFSEQEILKALKSTLENPQIQQIFLVEMGKVKSSEREKSK